jgi:phospholipid/cholesterol/gamma-HCH transport system substrate-binding protein
VSVAPDDYVKNSRGVLTPAVKAQLVAFVVITLLGVSYVSAKYVGLTKGWFGSDSCTIHADFPDSGGIFTNAEVTYRGVTIGKVGALHLIDKGVRVDLNLDNCKSPHIPATAAAVVSDRSVIGEQYVNLIPPTNHGPYLSSGQTIPMSRNSVPVSAKELLTQLDTFVNSVDIPALTTTIDELGQAFTNKGNDLGRLLDSSNALLTTAQQNLPQTLALLRTASTVLNTQLAERDPLISFTHSLNLLSAQLKTSDGDIRNLLATGPTNLDVISSFVTDNKTDLGVVIADLASTGQLLVRHLDGIEQILELYPLLSASGLTTIHPDGTSALGFILQLPADPPDCGDPTKARQGYDATVIRPPANTAPQKPNTAAHCSAPVSSGTNVRGSANVPGGDPISTAGGDVAYNRATTANTLTIGTSLSAASLLGDKSWLAILTTALN